MTQSIVVSIGQCGNQIGSRFWDLALREHATINPKNNFDSAYQSFFRNVDPSSQQVCRLLKTSLKLRPYYLNQLSPPTEWWCEK